MRDPLPAVVLFDLDDTILDYSSCAAACWQAVCRGAAAQLHPVTPEELFAAIETVRRWFWDDSERHRWGRQDMDRARVAIVTQALEQFSVHDSDLAVEMAERFITQREEAVRPFAGAIETLSRLREQDVRLGLVSNGDAKYGRNRIGRFALAPLFDYILIEGEFGIGKPDARVFRHVLEQLDGSAEDAWMVGDSLEYDIAPAQQVGIFAIWIDSSEKGVPNSCPVRPDRTISGIAALLS